MENVKYKM
jgi:hypothetical protein